MKIGLVSDTHNYFPLEIYTYFKEVDEIWHAGDIGQIQIVDQFNDFKPTRFVYGNIDDQIIRKNYPEYQFADLAGLKILMIHIAAKPPKYNALTQKLIKENRPSVLVCGHSHILKVMPDKTNNLIYMNPGAAGIVGFHKRRSLLRFNINHGKVSDLEAIDLGTRAQKKQA